MCGQIACVPDNTAACAGRECGRAINNCGETILCGSACSGAEVCNGGTCGAPVCGTVASRITVKTASVTSDAEGIFVARGDAGFTSWTVNTLKAAPIPLNHPGDLAGGTLVAWSPSKGGAIVPTIHVSRIRPDGTRVTPDFTVPGKRVLGLRATGSEYQVVVHRAVPQPDPPLANPADSINTTLTRFDLEGNVINAIEVQRVEDGGYGGPWNAAAGAFGWNGNNFMFFAGAGTYGHGGTNGLLLDLNGHRVFWPQWNLGCSHLYGNTRVAMNGTRIGAACNADALPPGLNFWSAGTGTIPSNDDGYAQVALGERSLTASLGEVVAAPNGFYIATATPDQAGNGGSSTKADIAIALMDANTNLEKNSPPRVWLTKTPDMDERAPHIVPFEDGYLAGWRDTGTTPTNAKYFVQKLTVEGQPVGSPEILGESAGLPLWFHDEEPWVEYPNGDVGWVWVSERFDLVTPTNPEETELLLVRIKSCP